MLQAGDTLAGYRVEAVAGVGGMGVVYRATQTSLDRPVALKVLSSTLVGNRTFRERFRREGRHAAALDHPNIIPVYEAGESNGLMFIAMRLVDGPSLADIIERRELSGRAAIGILRSIASALDAAHEAGLVHRDIKPQNMLLTRGGHPYLADFGITKGSDHGGLTHNGDFVGSLNYVAPEQIEGRDVGGASDIYSLAAVLFQALTGAYPYQRDTDAALMHAHMSAEPPTLSERGISGPRELDAVFARGMAKDPAARYATATGLIDACAAALAAAPADQLDRTPSFPPPVDDSEAEATSEPAPGTQPDRFVWTPPAVPPPTPVSTPVPARGAPAPQATPASAGAAAAAGAPAPPSDRTTTDSRRPSSEEAPEDDQAANSGRWKRPAAYAALALLVVAAPVAGYLLGHSPSPPEPVAARSAAVAVTHDAAWKPGTSGIEGLELDGAVTLRRADGVKLVAGRLPESAAGFDPLPKATRQRLALAATPTTAKLGDRTVVRYAGKLKTGDGLWVALAPDAKGWTAVACEGPAAELGAGCAAVGATLKVPGVAPVTPGADAEVAAALAAALKPLGTARANAAPGLRAKSIAKRASASRTLAAAHRKASAAVKAIDARPQEAALFVTLARALTAEAAWLSALGQAAGKRDATGYRRARAAVREQEERLAQALKRLKAAGYGT